MLGCTIVLLFLEVEGLMKLQIMSWYLKCLKNMTKKILSNLNYFPLNINNTAIFYNQIHYIYAQAQTKSKKVTKKNRN